MIQRCVDTVHLQEVDLNILQMVDDLQARCTAPVGGEPARRVFAVEIEQIASDRQRPSSGNRS